jgi:hypothetical protein
MKNDPHWPALLNLIRTNGFEAHCMSPSGDSGVLQYCAVIVGGYVIAEDGAIYPPEDIHRAI